MSTHKIAAIPGDGIGPEVIAAGLEVLEACAGRDGGFALDVQHVDWGSDHFKRHGVMMPPGGHELAVRAWDSAGQTQPARAEEAWNFKGYLCAAWHRVRVSVG